MIAVCLILLPAVVLSVPVAVAIDDPSAANLGNYERARFDLTESFQPLQTAVAANHDQVQAAIRARVAGVKNNEAVISIELPTQTVTGAKEPERLAFGEWTEWTAWSVCQNGEKSRVRTCVSRKLALRVICHGESIEVQKCYAEAANENIPFAQDPWSIEKEISGDFKL